MLKHELKFSGNFKKCDKVKYGPLLFMIILQKFQIKNMKFIYS